MYMALYASVEYKRARPGPAAQIVRRGGSPVCSTHSVQNLSSGIREAHDRRDWLSNLTHLGVWRFLEVISNDWKHNICLKVQYLCLEDLTVDLVGGVVSWVSGGVELGVLAR